MPDSREQYLKVALVAVGLIFIVGIYPLTKVWPAGWAWTPEQQELMQMILGVYATLGVFLLIASKNPLEHKSLIWFAVWSSAVHAAIMGVQAIMDPTERGHLIGDVPALFIVAIVLALLLRGAEGAAAQRT
jgi:hypothetical protein